MAGKQRAAVYHDNLPVHKCCLKAFAHHLIHRRSGSRDKYSPIDYQEIGIGCRQSVIIQIKWLRKRKRDEIVRLSVKSPELLQLPFHLCKRLIMRVIRICTPHICDGIR